MLSIRVDSFLLPYKKSTLNEGFLDSIKSKQKVKFVMTVWKRNTTENIEAYTYLFISVLVSSNYLPEPLLFVLF